MTGPEKAFDLQEYIMHHVANSDKWSLPFLSPISLPEWLTLHGLMMLLCGGLLIVLFCFVYRKDRMVPTGMTNVLEALIIFIRENIADSCLGKEEGRKMMPLLCTFFFFILGMNLMGLIPIFASATANVNVTGALAFITLSFMIGGSIYKNGIKGFFSALIPSGIPLPILFMIVPLEIIGLFVKAFALTLRLFANMLAGHIVILTLVGLVVLIGYVALPSIILAVMIMLLEILVAFLQAFIFTLLSALFIGHLANPEH